MQQKENSEFKPIVDQERNGLHLPKPTIWIVPHDYIRLRDQCEVTFSNCNQLWYWSFYLGKDKNFNKGFKIISIISWI